MESDSILNNDERSYGTNSTRSLTVSPSASMSRLNNWSSSGSLTSLAFPPSSLLLPLKSFSDSATLNTTKRSTRRPAQDKRRSDSDYGDEQDIDTSRIRRAAREAGIRSFGIAAVDVWLLRKGRFVHADGGLWVNPVFRKRHPSEALERIINPSHPDYAHPVPQVPGAGLAGYFWSLGVKRTSRRLLWRALKAITSDPLQPPYKRMGVLEEAGFGKATGIPFDILGHQGVVVYLARESASELMLNEQSNVEYLKFASQHIGTASAMTEPRREAEGAQEHRMSRTYRRVVAKIRTVQAFVSLRRSVSSRSLRNFSQPGSPQSERQSLRRNKSVHDFVGSKLETTKQKLSEVGFQVELLVRQRIELVMEKSRGSNLKPPPPVPLLNAAWAFSGSFLTLLILFFLSSLLQTMTGEELVLAPFGALLTLQFSLTAAPASQPRNVIYGQMVSLSLALIAKTLLHWSPMVVVPFATALAISAMAKLGCSHPPAAAAVVALFSEPDFSASSAVFLLIGNVVAVIMAVVVNNLSEKRQYPVYWEFGVRETFDNIAVALGNLMPRFERIEAPLDFREYLSSEESPALNAYERVPGNIES